MKKAVSSLEVILLSFMIGTSNVVLVLMIFGIIGYFNIGAYILLIEVIGLFFVFLWRNRSLSGLIRHNISFNFGSSDIPFLLLITFGLCLRFALMWSYLPNVAWDSLKFYLPWSKQIFEHNLIPAYDYTFNAGEPVGHSISFVLIGSLLYFWNGGANEILVYSISPIYALMTTLMIYIFVRKLLKDKILGYIVCCIFLFSPLSIFVGSVPYVDAMLCFFTMAFFLNIDSPYLAATSAAMAMLTKYSGFVLPLLLIGYLLWKRKITAIPSTVFVIFLFTFPWYLRNILLFHNPLPFMALTVKIFENPPKAFDVLINNGPSIELSNPTANILQFFSYNDLLSMVSRLIFLVYLPYTVMKRRVTAFYAFSFFVFILVFWLSGEHATRYLVPFYPLCLVSFMDIVVSVKAKIKSVWHNLPIIALICFFSMTFLGDFSVSYLFQFHILVGLIIVSLAFLVISLGLHYNVRARMWRKTIPMRNILVIALVGLFVFSISAQSYAPLYIIKEQQSNWQSGLLDVIGYVNSLSDKNQRHFLIIEDPGIRYYTSINSYELTHPYGAIKLDNLCDFPDIQSIFFGSDPRRIRTQVEHIVREGNAYDNVNNVEARINTVIVTRFSSLEPGEYLLVTNYMGSGYINKTDFLSSSSAWNISMLNITIVDSVITLEFTKNASLELRSILLFPLRIYTTGYLTWLNTTLKKYDIGYIVLSNTLSNVWVYNYYSFLTFISFFEESSVLFTKVYSSDYWALYKVK